MDPVCMGTPYWTCTSKCGISKHSTLEAHFACDTCRLPIVENVNTSSRSQALMRLGYNLLVVCLLYSNCCFTAYLRLLSSQVHLTYCLVSLPRTYSGIHNHCAVRLDCLYCCFWCQAFDVTNCLYCYLPILCVGGYIFFAIASFLRFWSLEAFLDLPSSC